MRLQIEARCDQANLPWTSPLAAWPGHLLLAPGCRPGEEWYLNAGPGTRVVLEVPAGRGRQAYALMTALADYGLPVARPLALAEERAEADDLLLLELPEHALPLGEALMAEGQSGQTNSAATAALLVLLDLAGLEGSAHERWRFAVHTCAGKTTAYLIYGEGRLNQTTTVHGQDRQALGNALSVAAREAFFEGEQVGAFAERTLAAYDQTWRQIAAVRLFVEGDIALKTRVVARAELPEPARPGAIELDCKVVTAQAQRLLLQLLTGLDVKGERARALLRDINRYHAWLEFASARPWPRALAANRWLAECFLPALAGLPHDIGKLSIGRGC